MATGHVFLSMSLDGFIARKDNQLDWLRKQNAKGEDRGFAAFMASVDGLVMGRVTYETARKVHQDWPYPKPVVVLSRSLSQRDVPAQLEGRVEISKLEPAALMESFGERGWSRVSVDGASVVQSFMRLGFVESIVINRIPILIGDGIPLFAGLEGDVDLELESSKAFRSGIVQSHYRIKNS